MFKIQSINHMADRQLSITYRLLCDTCSDESWAERLILESETDSSIFCDKRLQKEATSRFINHPNRKQIRNWKEVMLPSGKVLHYCGKCKEKKNG